MRRSCGIRPRTKSPLTSDGEVSEDVFTCGSLELVQATSQAASLLFRRRRMILHLFLTLRMKRPVAHAVALLVLSEDMRRIAEGALLREDGMNP